MQIISPKYFPAAFKICELRAKNFDIAHAHLSLGLQDQLDWNKELDNKLSFLFKSLSSYNFIDRVSKGTALFVGEGNFSFSTSIATNISNHKNIISSTYEAKNEISDLAKANANLLEKFGIKVLYEIDATKLNSIFGNLLFDTIIFQFPHTGTREAVDGHNPNYILVKEFLESSSKQLTAVGSILISTVDNEYYNNIFQFEELAELLRLKIDKYKFNPNDYNDYEHTMTHQDDSAIKKYSNFATWEFKL